MSRDGVGLIETVRVHAGIAPLWGRHLNRLYLSCKALGVPHPLELAVPEGGPDRVHRLLVRGGRVDVEERPVGPETPMRLVTARVAHRPYPHKTTERAVFDRALAEALAAGADDALLLAEDGAVAEATRWALLWWEGDRVAGPPLGLGVLPSVARARIAEVVGEIVERRVVRSGLEEREPFLANAARGIVGVQELDGRAVRSGPRFEELRRRFWG